MTYLDRHYVRLVDRLLTQVEATCSGTDAETLLELVYDLDDVAGARLQEFYAKGWDDALKGCRGLWRRLTARPTPPREGINGGD